MPTRSRFRPTARISVLLAGLLLAACSGGGTRSIGFQLVSVSVPGNGIWQINRSMQFVFSNDVDFSTVNLNTINVVQTSGAPASGEFSLLDARTVLFQPRCPTLDDYSDAGLLPGGVSYAINVPGSTAGGPTVRSMSGERLTQTQTLHFNTPNSTDPAVLFLDTALGPPAPVIRSNPAVLDACYLELGDDPANRVYFAPRAVADPVLGADTPAGFTSGLNLYSDVSSHLSILIAVNQAVGTSSSNISVNTVRLEYLTGAGSWQGLAHTVSLVANCTGTGALVRVTPTGILPQNHEVRVVLTQDFRDIVGDSNLISITVGSFLVATATDPGSSVPGLGADQVFEEFSLGGAAPGSLEDTASVLADPRAVWGQNGTLKAGFAFSGTGGPGGDFDWKIGNDLPLSISNHPEVTLDTSFSVITNLQQTAQETVINGRVDIRNLIVTASGSLIIQGPNSCTILVSGSVQIDGEITCEGNNNVSVHTLNTTNQPEPGATGKAGGGRGGTGSYLTTQSTPGGGPGFGAFDTVGGGGAGGESAFNPLFPNPDSDDEHRRPGGGGGGSFGPDFLRPANIQAGYTNPNLCPDQSVIGYDGENGFPGWANAVGVLTGASPPPGGARGPRPFFDNDPTNDFWGTMHTQGGQLIRGELLHPWAGAGGGAGGDAINSSSFPTNPFDPGGDEKGSGGGGGGGSLTILALGDITLGSRGRINASGGTGGGGENSLAGGITHIGGGSGGGSGGHIILQTATKIDLSAVTTSGSPPGGIYALGNQGGAGREDWGGAHPGGFQTSPQFDLLPPNSYPNTSALCGVVAGQGGYTVSNVTGNPAPPPGGPPECTGGDGSPGIIQFHTPTLADIHIPTTGGENIYKVCRPPPVGSCPAVGAPPFTRINAPLQWDQMLPIFGRRSQAISKWIPLGAASVSSDLTASAPDPVQFSFSGTDASGVILTTGSGPAAKVAELPPILSGVLAGSPTPPYVAADLRTVVFDPTSPPIGDDIYLRNTALLKRFVLRLTHAAVATDFEVASASYDAATHALRLTVDASGMPLAGFLPGDAVEVRPRFFRVITNGVPNSLPDSSQIVVEFQTTTENLQGDPDTGTASAWVQDITLLDPNTGANPDYRFLRFRISFDISANGAPLTFDTPIPSLDFFRVPFKF
jgi:hypothetical protein